MKYRNSDKLVERDAGGHAKTMSLVTVKPTLFGVRNGKEYGMAKCQMSHRSSAPRLLKSRSPRLLKVARNSCPGPTETAATSLTGNVPKAILPPGAWFQGSQPTPFKYTLPRRVQIESEGSARKISRMPSPAEWTVTDAPAAVVKPSSLSQPFQAP